MRVPSIQIVESATVEDGVVRLRSADGWISYLHAITGDPMLISAAEAGDDAEVRADPLPVFEYCRVCCCAALLALAAIE